MCFISLPMTSALTLRAGPQALAHIRERGLRAEDIDVIPGASGGAKWLVLGGIDRFLFGDFLQQPRTRLLHSIGSSIGSWRLACLAQRDPVAALARGHHAYIYQQEYTAKPSVREISEVSARVLDELLGPNGVDEILSHPFVRLHVITAEGRGLAASERKLMLSLTLAIAAAANVVSRKALALQLRRSIFHTAGGDTPFGTLADFPTAHHPLTQQNLRAALLASGSIPLLLEGVVIPETPGSVHWDGGVIDYHLDIDFGAGDGIVLYPHFYPHVIPGWFDKALRWRRARARNFMRTLLIAPSDEFVASLPGGRIPDRRDFQNLPHDERIRRWQTVLDRSAQLGDELRELIVTRRIADALQPWSPN